MEDVRFVIWGAGKRGKLITYFLKQSQIIAYIDSDKKKQRTWYLGYPIISFEEYRAKFQEHFIIVTPVDEGPILNELREYNINKYFRMSHLPSEMQGYGDMNFLDNMDVTLHEDGKNIILGLTLYSCLLYKRIAENGCENIFMYAGKECERAKLIENTFHYKFAASINRENDNLIATTPERDDDDLYKNFKVTDYFDVSDMYLKYYNPKLELFHNIHCGKSCFIVATGPSLREADLKVLADNQAICFGVNRIFNVDANFWKPQYYIFADRAGMEQYWEQIMSYEVDKKFLGDSYWKETDYQGDIYTMHTVTEHSFNVLPKFSERIENKVYAYGTVTYVAIQLAMYMGFSKIILLGVDCNYVKGSTSNYFFQEHSEDHSCHNENHMITAYKVAKEYAETKGVKILNATRGGMLEVFERINFDDIFAESGRWGC